MTDQEIAIEKLNKLKELSAQLEDTELKCELESVIAAIEKSLNKENIKN